ncbi:hypothetical protein [Phenylobacterium sp.]|uniref:hypothetical protein n=1 Tax=Phenylobacterium sp. TaxID=1871053 RepID=UPI0025E8D169|nr:hypothetical protein [Phenylobacterium sp.]
MITYFELGAQARVVVSLDHAVDGAVDRLLENLTHQEQSLRPGAPRISGSAAAALLLGLV